MDMRCGLRSSTILLGLVLFCALTATAQRELGELQLEVQDSQGAAVAASVELVSEANQVRRSFTTSDDGQATAQNLPLGIYRVAVTRQGFAPNVQTIGIHSEVPLRVTVTLMVTPVQTQVQVTDSATLIDPYRTTAVEAIGSQALREEVPAQPGRGLLDLVDSLPGWIFEANGVLHPRGSEYQVQFIVDGIPLTENRSPGFAAPVETSVGTGDSGSVQVRTADYPAEYGRKLGGVIEIATPKDLPSGLHGDISVDGGSFASAGGGVDLSYAAGANRLLFSGGGFYSQRYLDPPVLGNYTNSGSGGTTAVSYERDLSKRDRLRVSITHNELDFLVPNELLQQLAGQRQMRRNDETSGTVRYQRTISTRLLLDVQGSVRDTASNFSSNPLSTPILVSQQRGFREGYVRADLAGHHGRNDWKAGVDTLLSPVHEMLQYVITDPAQFDPGVQPQFSFSDRRWDREQSAFLQDEIRVGQWAVSAGIRFDEYRFVVAESAWSPRVGIAYFFPSLGLALHASYDRAFQTPAIENLLLASSPQVDSLSPEVLRLPVQPSRGNFYQLGFTKGIAGKLRIDANAFRRDFRDYADDDILLNTGVSFPIAFATAHISGEEVRLEVPRWGRFSGYLSYANQSGTDQGPVTGGLFLGDDATSALTDTNRIAISQDQRNTLRTRVRFQAAKRFWVAASYEYDSGLPVEIDSGTLDYSFLLSQYGANVLDRVNFNRGRVRPALSVGVGASVELYHKELRSVALLLQTANLTDRVNVTNFAGLFSGTAITPPRSASVRLRATF